MISIQRILICFCYLFVVGCNPDGGEISGKDWLNYKAHFISSDGRIIDTGNGNISHSEGQGYGMLLAIEHNDHEAFQNLWSWTQKNLQVRNDKLFIWRRRPHVDLDDEDPNNASDGDILIAWALLEADRKWHQSDYRNESLAILSDIKRKLIVNWQGLSVLLPGEQGFAKTEGITVNLSYWIFPAFRAFAAADPDPIWQQIGDNGLTLLQRARFGRWQLPPDWLQLANNNTLAPANNKRSGYDAVRIPLYLALANVESQTLSKFADYWRFYQGYTPAWTDLTENCIDGYGASPGINAIKQLTLWRTERARNIALPPLTDDQDYYSATLLMLSQLAVHAR